MNDEMTNRDQTDEDILTYTVSDEALLEAAGDVPGIYTETGILCPNRTLSDTWVYGACHRC
jgi:hypothetical protein